MYSFYSKHSHLRTIIKKTSLGIETEHILLGKNHH